MQKPLSRFAVTIGILAGLASGALAQDWPQFRGPGRTGITSDKGLAASWPESGPAKLWSVKLGIGFASPVVVDGKLYMFYLKDGNDVLECLNPADGKSIWKSSYPRGWTGSYPGTRCTPVIEGDRIYTYGGNSQLTAWNLADGKQIWQIDVLKETGGKQQQWAIASMPLIDGDVMYVQAGVGGNAAVCVNKKSGEIVWKSEPVSGSYATPVLASVDGKPQLILFAHKHLLAVDPKTGKLLWEVDEAWETQYNINAAMPIVQGNQVFVSCNYNNGHCGMFELSASGAKKLWGSKEVTTRFQPPIFENGVMYLNSEGTLKCVEWKTGKVLWATNDRTLLNNGGSLVRAGDKLILLSERGKLTLAKATPEKYEKISQLSSAVEGKQVWATPLVYQGKLFVKGEEELTCFDISAK